MKQSPSLFVSTSFLFLTSILAASDQKGSIRKESYAEASAADKKAFLEGIQNIDRRIIKILGGVQENILEQIAQKTALDPYPLRNLLFYAGFLSGRKLNESQYLALTELYAALIKEIRAASETTDSFLINLEFLDGLIEGCEFHQLKLLHQEETIRSGLLVTEFHEVPCNAFKKGYRATIATKADLATEQAAYLKYTTSQSPLNINFTALSYLRGLIAKQDVFTEAKHRTPTTALVSFCEYRVEKQPTPVTRRLSTIDRMRQKLAARRKDAPAEQPATVTTTELTEEELTAIAKDIEQSPLKPKNKSPRKKASKSSLLPNKPPCAGAGCGTVSSSRTTATTNTSPLESKTTTITKEEKDTYDAGYAIGMKYFNDFAAGKTVTSVLCGGPFAFYVFQIEQEIITKLKHAREKNVIAYQQGVLDGFRKANQIAQADSLKKFTSFKIPPKIRPKTQLPPTFAP